MDKYTLIGIGEILWDEFPGSKKLGGAPANFAFHANQLGARGMIISRVGDDLPGNKIKAELNKKEVPYLLSVDPDHPTGRVSVKTDKKGMPEYIIHENSSWDFLSFDPHFSEIARTADAVCFGTLAQRNPVSGQTIKNFIRATKKTCLKILDINLRQNYYSKKILSDLLNLADILKLNHDELNIITQMFLTEEEETACLEELISMFYLEMVVLTKGKHGSRIFADKYHDSIYKSKPVEMIDSVGAGDSFSAVVALGLLNGFGLEKINKTASSVASYVCTKKGATPVIPKKIIHSMN
ncbi:MAG: bifunctional hydroxymethylpyrimidine kinase/phosphomethylpyrimidine kinase [Desulfobacula sp.]|uniref:PfkB family carbohydrate kinase n=1 Tax=Desulfobacula sp. TaxID=2593537 RepID=UPI0025B88854|nr:PfkB family carbohydrate kinase [Desulfobacula sp.]MCD4722340.1 bifunctional hydroxymethylpyrimidine kinase/phosphomethylpyrimidine kinase [Desulfobacula sp.]